MWTRTFRNGGHCYILSGVEEPTDRGRDQPDGDLMLVRAAERGESEAVEDVGRRLACVPAMVRLRERHISLRLDPDERLETVQEIIAALWSKLSSYRAGSSLEAWAYGFVVREHYKTIRRRHRHHATHLDLEQEAAPKARVFHGDEQRSVHAAIDALDAGDAAIVRMRHFDERAFHEIAEVVGMPLNTAKTRYYRAVGKLRTSLRSLWDVSGV